MRVLVTGATGFVGRAVVPVLRAAGHEVAAFDRAGSGDIARIADWRSLLAGVQSVVHLAAIAHARGVDEARLRDTNVNATLLLGRAAAAAGARMLFMSSVKALGEETSARPFDDTSPLAPQDAYGRAKADAEAGLRAVTGLVLTILRPPLVYGPGVKGNFLALMRAVARGWPLPLASIANKRSLLYVGNLADAVLRCIDAPAAQGSSFLVSDGIPVSTPGLCRALGAALGKPARLLPFPPRLLPSRRLTGSLVVDDRAIRRELAWTPPVPFEEGLRRTAQWFLTQGG